MSLTTGLKKKKETKKKEEKKKSGGEVGVGVGVGDRQRLPAYRDSAGRSVLPGDVI